MDGINALPDEDVGSSEYGDESACAFLQHETSNAVAWTSKVDRGDLGSLVLRKVRGLTLITETKTCKANNKSPKPS